MAIITSNDAVAVTPAGTELALNTNPFEGIKSGHTTTQLEDMFFKMAIVGKQKSGKSWFAATAPGPIHFADFDNRKKSVLQYLENTKRTDVLVKTYYDKDMEQPNAIAEFEKDMAMYKYNYGKSKPAPVTYVLDSMTFMKKAIENELMKQLGPTIYRTVKTTPTRQIRIPKGWDAVNAVRAYLEYVVGELSAIGNLIVVFHEKLERDNAASTPELAAYTGQYTVDPQYLASLLSTFDEVFRITVNGNGKYEVTTRASYEFNAATTMIGLDKELPNIVDMQTKSRAARAKINNKP